MKCKLILCSSCLITVFSMTHAAIGFAKTKGSTELAVIAIIDASARGGQLTEAISLMTANLTGKAAIGLVEREDLNLVLHELELSGSQLVTRENSLKLGRLLGADGLVVLALSEDGKALRVRLIDTRYGFRLLDTFTGWKESDLNSTVERIIADITRASVKLIMAPGEQVFVGIMNIRNVGVSPRLNWLEVTLPGLISSKSSSDPRIIVLEREDLNLVSGEKLFTRGGDTGFVGSIAVLEGEIEERPGGDNSDFTLNLKAKQADETSIGDFSLQGDTEKLPQLAQEIGDRLAKLLSDSPPRGTWDTKTEASRFSEEARVLVGHRDHEAARPLLETAHVLDPENEEILETLLKVLPEGRTTVERAVMVNRRIELLAAQFQRGMSGVKVISNLDEAWEYLNSKSSIETEEIRNFNKQTRRHCAELSERAYSSAQITDYKAYAWWLTKPLGWASAVSGTPQEAMMRIRKAMSRLMLRPEKGGYPLEDHHWIMLLQSYVAGGSQYHILSAAHLEKNEVLKLWLGFVEEMTKSDDPVIKLHAELELAELFRAKRDPLANTYPALNYDHVERAIQILYEELGYPNEPLTSGGRFWLRMAIRERALNWTIYRTCLDKWIDKAEKLLKPLADKDDVENLLLWSPTSYLDIGHPAFEPDPDTGRRTLALTDTVIKVLEEYGARVTDAFAQAAGGVGQPYKQLGGLKNSRTKFLQRYPELRPREAQASSLKVSILCDMKNYVPDMKRKDQFDIEWKPVARQGKLVYVALVATKEAPDARNELWLIGIDLEAKSVRSFWRARLRGGRPTRPVLGEDKNYVGVKGLGIVAFPGTATQGVGLIDNPEVMTQKDGLPSSDIIAIARVGHKLYVSLGYYLSAHFGLGSYDLRKRQWTTISSSRARDSSCPLNTEQDYRIISMAPAPDGKKLFFLCEDHSSMIAGLWKMDTESGKMEHIWRFNTWFGDIVQGEDDLYIRDQNVIVSFDPASETGRVIAIDKGEMSLVTATPGRERLSIEGAFGVSESLGLEGHNSALFKGVLWLLTQGIEGTNVPCCLFIDSPALKVVWPGVDILGESWITTLHPTPYGVVVVGDSRIGLVEENPKP